MISSSFEDKVDRRKETVLQDVDKETEYAIQKSVRNKLSQLRARNYRNTIQWLEAPMDPNGNGHEKKMKTAELKQDDLKMENQRHRRPAKKLCLFGSSWRTSHLLVFLFLFLLLLLLLLLLFFFAFNLLIIIVIIVVTRRVFAWTLLGGGKVSY
jgi:Flp pilus assembly protein TadB